MKIAKKAPPKLGAVVECIANALRGQFWQETRKILSVIANPITEKFLRS